jgi:hypothetical protein
MFITQLFGVKYMCRCFREIISILQNLFQERYITESEKASLKNASALSSQRLMLKV